MNTIYSRQPSSFSIVIITMILIISIIPLGTAKSENTLESKSTKEEITPESKNTEDKSTTASKNSNDKSTLESKNSDDKSTVESKNSDNMRVKITQSLPFLDVNHSGETVRIQRIQEKDYKLTNSYAKTSRSCPPFCIRPIHLSSGVKTVGELEVLDFLKTKVQQDEGILIDARLKDWNVKGTIPGSVNIPFTMFTGGLEDISTVNLLELLGVKEDEDDNWDFDETIELMLFCNGPWCGQSQKAIKYLLKLGYPAKKIYWYRGGMQAWQSFGLTVIKP